MEGAVTGQPAGRHTGLLASSGQAVDGGQAAGQHKAPGRVVAGHIHAMPGRQRLGLLKRGADRQHRRRLAVILHAAPADERQLPEGRRVKHAGRMPGRQLTKAVAQHPVGAQAQAGQQAQRRDADLGQARLQAGGVLAAAQRGQPRQGRCQVRKARSPDGRASVQRHALAWEQHGQQRRPLRRPRPGPVRRQAAPAHTLRRQAVDELAAMGLQRLRACRHQAGTPGQGSAWGRQAGCGQVDQVRAGQRRRPPVQLLQLGQQLARVAGLQGDQFTGQPALQPPGQGPGSGHGQQGQRPLQHHMAVHAAKAKGVDTHPHRASVADGLGGRQHPHRSGHLGLGQYRMRVDAACGGRQGALGADRQGLEQAGQAGRRLGMSDIGLDRPHRHRRAPLQGGIDQLRQRAELDRVTGGRAGAMGLEVVGASRVQARRRPGPLQGQQLPASGRPGQAALPVGGQTGAADPAQHRPGLALHQRRSGQDHTDTTLTRPEAVGLAIKDPHFTLRQRAVAGKADQLEGVQAQVHCADHHAVHVARLQPITGGDDGQQRRCAGAIHRKRTAAQIEVVGDTPGNRVGQRAGQAVGIGRREGCLEQALEVVHQRLHSAGRQTGGGGLAQAPLDKGPAIAQRVGAAELTRQGVGHDDRHAVLERRVSGPGGGQRGQRAVGHVQRHPVRQVGGAIGGQRHHEALAVEDIALDQRGLNGIETIGVVLGAQILLGVQALRRQATEALAAMQRQLPQRLRRAGLRQLAGSRHHGNRRRHAVSFARGRYSAGPGADDPRPAWR